MSEPFYMAKKIRSVANRVLLEEAFEEQEHPRYPRGHPKGGQFKKKWYRGRRGEWKKTKEGREYFVPDDISDLETEGLLDQIDMGLEPEHFRGEDMPGFNAKTGEITDADAYFKALDMSGSLSKMEKEALKRMAKDQTNKKDLLNRITGMAQNAAEKERKGGFDVVEGPEAIWEEVIQDALMAGDDTAVIKIYTEAIQYTAEVEKMDKEEGGEAEAPRYKYYVRKRFREEFPNIDWNEIERKYGL